MLDSDEQESICLINNRYEIIMKEILQVLYNILFYVLIIVIFAALRNFGTDEKTGDKDEQDYIYEYKYDDDGLDNGRRDGII